MLRMLALLLATLCLVVCVPQSAEAFSCLNGSCPKWCNLPVSYALEKASDDIGEAMTEAELRRGMDDWTREECSGLRTQYRGRTNANPQSHRDQEFVVGWIESGWPAGSSVIGQTSVSSSVGGQSCIVSSDMIMNGVHFNWVTGAGSGSNVNTYSISLHEGGHYFGLGHSQDRGATMFPSYSGGIAAINADDQLGICTLYPGMGDVNPPADCTTEGCPNGFQCVNRMCEPNPPNPSGGAICAPCTTNNDCGGAEDKCLIYSNGTTLCGKFCTADSDCGGDVCLASIQQCVRRINGRTQCDAPDSECTTSSECMGSQICEAGDCVDPPSGAAGLGEPCSMNTDCAGGLCIATGNGSICTQSCNGLDPTSCPGGFYCDGDATGVCGEGYCFAGGPGSASLGDTCSQDTDCSTLMCAEGKCATPCTPGGANGCANGFTCETLGGIGCGACVAGVGSGGGCDMNEDCDNGVCVMMSGVGTCIRTCESDAECGAGFLCRVAGGMNTCVPGPTMQTGPNLDAGSVLQGGACSVSLSGGFPGASALFGLLGVLVWRRRK